MHYDSPRYQSALTGLSLGFHRLIHATVLLLFNPAAQLINLRTEAFSSKSAFVPGTWCLIPFQQQLSSHWKPRGRLLHIHKKASRSLNCGVWLQNNALRVFIWKHVENWQPLNYAGIPLNPVLPTSGSNMPAEYNPLPLPSLRPVRRFIDSRKLPNISTPRSTGHASGDTNSTPYYTMKTQTCCFPETTLLPVEYVHAYRYTLAPFSLWSNMQEFPEQRMSTLSPAAKPAPQLLHLNVLTPNMPSKRIHQTKRKS